MDTSLLVDLVVFLLVIAIAWWAVTQLALPPPVRMVVVGVGALLAIVFLLSLTGGLGHHALIR